MNQTNFVERLIGCNEVRASIIITVEKGWDINFDDFTHFWEKNAMTDISLQYFGVNISWFCENGTDLLNLFQKNPFIKSGLLNRL